MKYFSYFVIIKIMLEFEVEFEFLVVIICNFNMLRKFIVERNNFIEVIDQVLMSKVGIIVNDIDIDWDFYKDLDVFDIYW